jgi:hypothetical protein
MRRTFGWVRSLISVSSEDLDYSSRGRGYNAFVKGQAEHGVASVTKMLC